MRGHRRPGSIPRCIYGRCERACRWPLTALASKDSPSDPQHAALSGRRSRSRRRGAGRNDPASSLVPVTIQIEHHAIRTGAGHQAVRHGRHEIRGIGREASVMLRRRGKIYGGEGCTRPPSCVRPTRVTPDLRGRKRKRKRWLLRLPGIRVVSCDRHRQRDLLIGLCQASAPTAAS